MGLTKSCDENGSETIDLQVGGVVVEVLTSSGPSCNMVDRRMWEELKQKGIKCISENTTQKLYPYETSEPINTLGKFQVTVSAAGKETTVEFIVICHKGRPIIGRKTATELKYSHWGHRSML